MCDYYVDVEIVKELTLIVWMAQLGMNVACPLGGFVVLAVWLQRRFGLGDWVIFVGLLFGICGAIDGLRTSLKAMDTMANGKNTKTRSSSEAERKSNRR